MYNFRRNRPSKLNFKGNIYTVTYIDPTKKNITFSVAENNGSSSVKIMDESDTWFWGSVTPVVEKHTNDSRGNGQRTDYVQDENVFGSRRGGSRRGGSRRGGSGRGGSKSKKRRKTKAKRKTKNRKTRRGGVKEYSTNDLIGLAKKNEIWEISWKPGGDHWRDAEIHIHCKFLEDVTAENFDDLPVVLGPWFDYPGQEENILSVRDPKKQKINFNYTFVESRWTKTTLKSIPKNEKASAQIIKQKQELKGV